MLAKALADELKPWLARIKALETENAVQQRRIELLEMTNIDLKAEVKAMSYRDRDAQPQATKTAVPFGRIPGIGSRSLRDAH